jgi:hypothetical protein
MLKPSQSTSTGRPTARRRNAALSTLSARLPAAGVEHHQPPHGVDRIDDADVGPQSVPIDGEEERARRLAALLQEIGRTEEQVYRVAKHARTGEPDAERIADRAGGAIAADQIARHDAFACAALEIDEVGNDAVAGVLERFEPGAMAKPHAGRGLRQRAQHRVEPHLRTGLQPHRAVAFRRLPRARGSRHAADLVAVKARHEHHVKRIVGGERAVQHLVGDAPAPAELHRADVDLVHLGRGDRAVGLLDQLAADAAPAEVGRECEAHRPAADDKNGNCAHSKHSDRAGRIS